MTIPTALTRGLLIIGLGLMSLSAGLFLKGAADGGVSHIQPTGAVDGDVSPIRPTSVSVFMGEVADRSPAPFEFTLTNGGTRPLKVVGTPVVCGQRGCVEAIDPPKSIQPRESVVFHYVCSAHLAGPVELATEIYLDAGEKDGIAVPVTFHGTVVAAKKAP